MILGNDKFKVVFFDNEGHVTMVEESQQRKRKSEANLYVVPFGRYNLSETMPLSMMKRLDEEVIHTIHNHFSYLKIQVDDQATWV